MDKISWVEGVRNEKNYLESRGKEYCAYDKKEGGLDWSHLA